MGAVDKGSVEERLPSPPAEELHLLERLRRGDEAAFATLIERYHTLMIRLAMSYVSRHAVAEEVAQETWLAVLQRLNRFEEPSSLQTWIFRILTNRANIFRMRLRPEESIPDSVRDELLTLFRGWKQGRTRTRRAIAR